MTNEAVIIELGSNGGNPMTFTVADGATIEKGALLSLADPNTAAANSAQSAFAGIAAAEKVASDGSTTLAAYTSGVFDLLTASAITAGAMVIMSGANAISGATAGSLLTGQVVGKALETATNGEVIAVAIGTY